VGGRSIRKINNLEELEGLLDEARGSLLWLFKHSLVCPLSTEGRREFERFVAETEVEALFAVIEVQNARDVSNEVARRVGVRHETPQAILMSGEDVLWNGSHWDVSAATLARAVRAAASSSGASS
jgi:bacillithiol system protein YtxJ